MSEPLGVTVCRLSLDPVRGRIRHPLQVGVAVRAGMFCELALAGRMVGAHWPEALGDPDTGQPLLDSVHAAVASRGPTRWKRWYSHVDADRDAASRQLIASGRWRLDGRRIIDTDPGSTVHDQQQIMRQLASREPPQDLAETILTLLVGAAGGAGRPAPRRCRTLAKQWLSPQLMTSGRAGDAVLSSVIASTAAIRRANPVPLLSR
ncbi:MAG: GPP34 family phosphoprotein [Jatrophihabitantaceae bacterium]